MNTIAARDAQGTPSGDADDIASAAAEMIRRYPFDAILRAEARYDSLLSLGRVDSALRWWQILREIQRLTGQERGSAR